MRKGLLPYGSGFFFKKGISNDRKKRKKAEKMDRTFSCSSDVTDGLRQHRTTGSSTSSASGTSAVSESSTSTASAADVSESQTESTSVSESTAESESTSEATAESSTSGSDTASADGFATTDDVSDAPDITGITIESKMVLNYAECFNVYYCHRRL